ncbi:serine hydrolase, partial [Mammaliicoccus sciuri]|uniref:serine hydrolase n=1 Tax=Mammaliicoccus sciuri TaxID=1296 RepID=UPI0031FE9707
PTPTNPTAAQYAGASFSAYGLGWFLQDSYGRREAQHGGGLPGMVSQISIFPGSGFGVMVMSNKSTRASSAIAMRLANLAFSDHP